MRSLATKAFWAVAALASKVLANPPLDELDSIIPVEPISNCLQIEQFEISNDPGAQNFFIDDLQGSMCRTPKSQDCLFYDSGLSRFAQSYAQQTQQITIWDIWQTKYYATENTPDNLLRCIMYRRVDRLAYFKFMSTSMAALCDSYAQYLTPDVNNPGLEGFFGLYEFPQLQKVGKNGKMVEAVDAISQAGPGADLVRMFTRSEQNSKMLRARKNWQFGPGLSTFNATVHEGPQERAILVPRDGCGASPETAAALDQCGVGQIPW